MKRKFIIPIVLAAALSMIHILPKRGSMAPTSLNKKEVSIENGTPPLWFGEWSGKRVTPSKEELDILAKDTKFIKGEYSSLDMPAIRGTNGQLFENSINLSIVISGHDINHSIHRPERCLTARGNMNLVSTSQSIDTPSGKTIGAQRITSFIPLPPDEEGNVPPPIGFLSYYYFVGHKSMTHNHTNRILNDMKSRLLSGTDRQWSFIMVSVPYNFGTTESETEKNYQDVDKKIRQFLSELTDRIVDWNDISN